MHYFFIYIILLLFIIKSILAISLDSIIVFGDSYSDNKNGSFKISNGLYPPPPYFDGRFSNGPVWVEYLSDKLNIPLVDYATGGATTNSITFPGATGMNEEIVVPGIRQQINDYVVDAHNNGISGKNNTSLYVVSAPINDYIHSIRNGLELPKTEKIIGEFVTNIQTLIIEVGALDFLVATLPKFGDSPAFSRSNESERESLSKLVEDHNILLRQALGVLKSDFRKMKYFITDVEKVFKKFPSQNFTESCLSIDYTGTQVCSDPEKFLFWDNLHINTRAHEILASEAYDLLT